MLKNHKGNFLTDKFIKDFKIDPKYKNVIAKVDKSFFDMLRGWEIRWEKASCREARKNTAFLKKYLLMELKFKRQAVRIKTDENYAKRYWAKMQRKWAL